MGNSMTQSSSQKIHLLQILTICSILFTLLALIVHIINQKLEFQATSFYSSPQITIIVLIIFFFEAFSLGFSYTKQREKILTAIEKALQHLSRLKALNLIIFALNNSAFGFIILGNYGGFAEDISMRIFLVWILTLCNNLLLMAYNRTRYIKLLESWQGCFATSLIFAGFCYKVAFFFQTISAYPFTLTWSETSRYYYASLFFAKRIYGVTITPTVLHPSRYLMQAFPFLLPNSPLWLHRAWQVFLYLGTTFLTGWILVRRLSSAFNLRERLTILWISIFIFLGPVYYHLLVPVLVILLGFNHPSLQNKKIRTLVSLASVLTASAWAGISRLNWFPVPGLLASTLFILETPVTDRENQRTLNHPKSSLQKIFRYILSPILFTMLGIATAFISQTIYIYITGNQLNQFTSSLSSDLLWHRLLPNPTYPPGIFPATILVSLPLIIIAFSKLKQYSYEYPYSKRYHPIRYLGVLAILGVLFMGGLVVSVKIGGGSNLHNLDAYLITLLIVTIYFFYDKPIPEFRQAEIASSSKTSSTLMKRILKPDHALQNNTRTIWGIFLRLGIAGAIIIPIIFTLSTGNPATALPDPGEIKKSMETIREFSNYAVQNGGEVLFISNRHLIPFHYIDQIPLISDYERVFLMEMAMAKNEQYLNQFHQDIKNHRFALIISEPLTKNLKDYDLAFGAENNAWIEQITKYILCYYKPHKTFRPTQIQILIPNTQMEGCP